MRNASTDWPPQVSSAELKQLLTVSSVVRQGRVAALHLDKIEFENGTSFPRYNFIHFDKVKKLGN